MKRRRVRFHKVRYSFYLLPTSRFESILKILLKWAEVDDGITQRELTNLFPPEPEFT